MHIRPLAQLSDREIGELARAAADRGEAHDGANPYDAGTAQRAAFKRAYEERERDLQPIT